MTMSVGQPGRYWVIRVPTGFVVDRTTTTADPAQARQWDLRVEAEAALLVFARGQVECWGFHVSTDTGVTASRLRTVNELRL